MKTKVLIPVDRARNSLTAEEYAIRLHWRMPLTVTLLNVLNIKRLEGHGISPDDQGRIKKTMRANAEKILAEASEPFIKAEMEYVTRTEEGSPGEVICRIAEKEGFEMVIIPQSGLSEWEEFIAGSVVSQVLHRCQAPVLLVKHTESQLERQRKLRAEQDLLPG